MQILFFFCDRPLYSDKCGWRLRYITYLGSLFFLILILSKKKVIQSGALLKMSSSSPSMDEFGLDIHKKLSVKQANKERRIFSKILKAP